MTTAAEDAVSRRATTRLRRRSPCVRRDTPGRSQHCPAARSWPPLEVGLLTSHDRKDARFMQMD